MPAKSKQQQKFMGIVRAIQKGEAPAGKFSKAAQKAAKSMKKGSVRKYAKTKHDDLPKKVKEEKKRDYKAEYKKFQSSTKAKKYRAELNKYNRKKGTYGNGDGKDASHKGGKIVGFESQSKNRGRAEKSRLKKEAVITENPAVIATAARMAIQNAQGKKVSVNTARQTSYAKKDPSAHKKAKSIFQRIKDKFKKKDKPAPKKQSKSDVDFYKRQYTGESVVEKVTYHDGGRTVGIDVRDLYNYLLALKKANPDKFKKDMQNRHIKAIFKRYSKGGEMYQEGFGGELKGKAKQKFEKARKENAEVLGYKLTGKSDINEVNIKDIQSVLKKKQAKKINGMYMDMTTANAIMTVYKALNKSNQKKFTKLPLRKMVDVTWKLVK